MDTGTKRLEVEKEQDWLAEAATMPLISFPEGWKIQILPPFSDAVVRFKVTLPSGLVKSVFLDSRCALDCYFDETGNAVPYWEVSLVAGKWGRCDKNNIEALLEMIAYEDED